MKTSVFDLFRIGIGPSSSHTVGPMRAAREFVQDLRRASLLPRVTRIQAELYGSLALTGIGHGTDRAVLLGLSGEAPETVDTTRVEELLAPIRRHSQLSLDGRTIEFVEGRDLLFRREEILPGHPNGMRFSAFADDSVVYAQVFYSIGGGFITREGESGGGGQPASIAVPYPFSNGAELLAAAEREGLTLAELMLANELALRPRDEVLSGLDRLWSVMNDSIERGLATEGVLPGGLNVRRRAPRLWQKVQIQAQGDPFRGLDLVNVFAMAVNEENAAGGRVVTAPTNGAAGLLPAVTRYYRDFIPEASKAGIRNLLLTAGAIGILYKENASISGAEVGCQGEVGVACSMAAAGLAGALGADAATVEHAAEIGMEHHLGMTCDPIGGLVQIPCIERNAIGAVKAINACRMAMQGGGEHKVSLDQVIRTMYQTGLDMQSRYKETALAGLAVNVKAAIPVNVAEC